MKAAVFYGKEDLRIEELPVPTPGAGEVLLRVRACGICGTDVHIYHGDEGAAPTPVGTVLGHEFAGEVVAIGEGVTDMQIGDRVCADPNELCGKCAYCLGGIGHYCTGMNGYGTTKNGGFAEYCVIPRTQVYHIGKDTSFEMAAMTEPVACCLHGIDMCDIAAGDTVAVIGGGMIGLLMLQLAALRGAGKLILIEPIAEKREIARRLGADLCIDPLTEDVQTVLKQNNITRISTVIECVGRVNTMEMAIAIAGVHATVMLFGLTAPAEELTVRPFEIFQKELTIRASFINPDTQARAWALIDGGRLDVSTPVCACEPLERLPEILRNPALRAKGKVIILP